MKIKKKQVNRLTKKRRDRVWIDSMNDYWQYDKADKGWFWRHDLNTSGNGRLRYTEAEVAETYPELTFRRVKL